MRITESLFENFYSENVKKEYEEAADNLIKVLEYLKELCNEMANHIVSNSIAMSIKHLFTASKTKQLHKSIKAVKFWMNTYRQKSQNFEKIIVKNIENQNIDKVIEVYANTSILVFNHVYSSILAINNILYGLIVTGGNSKNNIKFLLSVKMGSKSFYEIYKLFINKSVASNNTIGVIGFFKSIKKEKIKSLIKEVRVWKINDNQDDVEKVIIIGEGGSSFQTI
jgi:hypothetical protein